jgi:tripartite-type tricarboxylate transporter receptor subunit TctC
MLSRRRFLAASAGLASSGLFAPHIARAQMLSKPVKLIVGFPAGGGTDVIARLLAEKLRGNYASTVIVENKPGASARLAVDFVKTSDPDGTTLLFTPDFPLTVYPYSFKSLSYDPVKDLTPIAPTASSMLTFNVGPGVPASVKNAKDFVEWCKANPSKSSYATTSAGGTPHFVGVMLSQAAGVPMQAVHYRGGAPALQDLIGGHVPASVNPISEAMPLAEQGSLRVLAVTGPKRSKFMPNVPTMKESGYDVVLESWLGVIAPNKMPPDILKSLSTNIETAVKSPDYAESLAKFGNEPTFLPLDTFAVKYKEDIAKWGPIVKASGFIATD